MGRLVWVLLVLGLAAQIFAVNATDPSKFHLWLKCKAIELYVNVTGANFTIPQCEMFNFTNATFIVGRSRVAPLPMIGVGELKMLNVSDPHAVFWEIKRIRREALGRLDLYVNRSLNVVYSDLNRSRGLEEAINATERGYYALRNVTGLLRRVNASHVAVAAVERNLYWINFSRSVLREIARGNFTERWLRERLRNGTEDEVDRALDEVERLMERVRGLMEHFERVKIAGVPRQIVSSILREIENKTRPVLIDIKEAARRGVAKDVIEAVRRGDIQGAREAARRAVERAREAAGRGVADSRGEGRGAAQQEGRGGSAAENGRGGPPADRGGGRGNASRGGGNS